VDDRQIDSVLDQIAALWTDWKPTNTQRVALRQELKSLDAASVISAARSVWMEQGENTRRTPNFKAIKQRARVKRVDLGDLVDAVRRLEQVRLGDYDTFAYQAAVLRFHWAKQKPQHADWYRGLTDRQVLTLNEQGIRKMRDERERTGRPPPHWNTRDAKPTRIGEFVDGQLVDTEGA